MKRLSLLLFAAGLTLPTAALAQDFSQVEIKAQKLSDSIYLMMGAGGNLGLCVGPDGPILIDDQFGALSNKIKAAIATVTDRPVRYLINTHWHSDHTGGNAAFGTGGAVIVAHDNVRRQLSVETFMKAFNSKEEPAPEVARPVITFTDAVTFHQNGETIRVFHIANAHTDGDALIYFEKSNVLHTGDCLFNGLFPFIDTQTGGSINGMIAAADKVLPMINDATKIIPGHGPLATKADYQAFRDMLAGIRDGVAKQLKAGKSSEETVASKPAAAWDAKWGGGFLKTDRFVAMVYDDLKGVK